MANIFKGIMNEYCIYLIQISLCLFQRVQWTKRWSLVQVMAWCWTGTKALPEPLITNFTGVASDKYIFSHGLITLKKECLTMIDTDEDDNQGLLLFM